MTYVDYEYYQKTYKGGLSTDLFDKYVLKASREIDTNVNRILAKQDITDAVKYVTCELIELIYETDTTNKIVVDKDGRQISSISIDDVKKEYCTVSENDKTIQLKNYKARKQAILNGLPTELTRYI